MTQPTATIPAGPQRLQALERANQVRLARASLKRRIALGEVTAADVLLTCPPEASSWPIGSLLVSQRRWGSSRCRKFLASNQIVETKPIGTLTERQRRMLAESLRASIRTPVAGPINGSASAPEQAPVSAPVQESPREEMALAIA